MKPRIRTIKPEAHTDEDLWDLEQETGLPIFRAFTGLWCHADKEGRFEWRPRPLKAGILPYWDGDFSRVLDALATRGFVRKYTCDGREFGVIDTFQRHQFINGKEPESELPDPPERSNNPEVTRDGDACLTREGHVAHVPIPIPFPSLPVPRGGAGGDRGTTGTPATTSAPAAKRRPKASRWRKVPADWQPNDGHRAKAAALRVDFDAELEKFRDHEFRSSKTDADAAFRTWLSNAADFARGSPRSGSQRGRTPQDSAGKTGLEGVQRL